MGIGVDWSYYSKKRFEDINEKYLPPMGEGETMATQIVTAVNKLVYKWYNDGDVYDNTWYLQGWCNDLSSYANWLAEYVHGVDFTLRRIEAAFTDADYEYILQDLADECLNEKFLSQYDRPKQGTIYDCNGKYKFDENWGDEEEEYD